MIQFILAYGHSEFTKVCIESLYKNTPYEEINLVVWQNNQFESLTNGVTYSPDFNTSNDQITEEDINPKNTILLNMDQNYGVSAPINCMLKDFGLNFNQDVFYISNDHYLLPKWINPWLKNEREVDVGNSFCSHAIDAMHSYLLQGGFPDHWRHYVENTQKRLDLLDYPECKHKIKKYIDELYTFDPSEYLGKSLDKSKTSRFIAVDPFINCSPEEISVANGWHWWAGCYFVNKKTLEDIPLYPTDVGKVFGEKRWWSQITNKLKFGIYADSFIHHFGSITNNRPDLEKNYEDMSVHPPQISEQAEDTIKKGVEKFKNIINN